MSNDKRKHDKEDSVLTNLINCYRALYRDEVEITCYPDREIKDGKGCVCDAIIGGLSSSSFSVAVEVSEVTLSIEARSENAHVDDIRKLLEPWIESKFVGEIITIDVTYDSDSKHKFVLNKIVEEIKSKVEMTPIGEGHRKIEKSIYELSSGFRIKVNRHVSDYPGPCINCYISPSSSFNDVFERILDKKLGQFDAYAGKYLLCVLLWSDSISIDPVSEVVEAFKQSSVDTSKINSIWFTREKDGGSLVYPLYTEEHDSRVCADYIKSFQFNWPPMKEPYVDISLPNHPFGTKPIQS